MKRKLRASTPPSRCSASPDPSRLRLESGSHASGISRRTHGCYVVGGCCARNCSGIRDFATVFAAAAFVTLEFRARQSQIGVVGWRYPPFAADTSAAHPHGSRYSLPEPWPLRPLAQRLFFIPCQGDASGSMPDKPTQPVGGDGVFGAIRRQRKRADASRPPSSTLGARPFRPRRRPCDGGGQPCPRRRSP